ncbi:MAG: A24 family peptidase [Pseudomonadota bacterium]
MFAEFDAGFVWNASSFLVLAALVVWVAWVDIRTLRIPVLALVLTPSSGLIFAGMDDETGKLLPRILGSIGVFGLLFFINQIFKWRNGVNGLGSRDAPYAAGLAVWIPVEYIPYSIVLACLITFVVKFIKDKSGRSSRMIPFAPGLGLGVLLVYCSSLTS